MPRDRESVAQGDERCNACGVPPGAPHIASYHLPDPRPDQPVAQGDPKPEGVIRAALELWVASLDRSRTLRARLAEAEAEVEATKLAWQAQTAEFSEHRGQWARRAKIAEARAEAAEAKADEVADKLASCYVRRSRAEAQLAQAREALEEAEMVVEYVSRGRKYVDVEAYPDALARKANFSIRRTLEQGDNKDA